MSWADEQLMGHLIVDDDELALLAPRNAQELGELVSALRKVPGDVFFNYDHVRGDDGLVRTWGQRVAQLESLGADRLGGPWAEMMARQRRCLALAAQVAAQVAAPDQTSLYGSPQPDLFYGAVREVTEETRARLELYPDQPLVQALGTGLLTRLPSYPSTVTAGQLPSADAVAALHGWFEPIIRPWLAVVDRRVPAKGKVEAATIEAVWAEILKPYDQRVETSDEARSIAYQPSLGQLSIPKDRSMTRAALRTNVAHEAVHILRHLNGRQGPLLLGAFGLPGYLPFEEGLATAATTVATGGADVQIESFARPEAYLAIGLAAGLAAEEVSTDGLYQILLLHYGLGEAVKQAKKVQKGELEEVGEEAVWAQGHKQAWDRIVRTRRGSNGQAGFCPRDLSYRDGNQRVWTFVAEHPDWLSSLLAAKADPTIPTHAAYLGLC